MTYRTTLCETLSTDATVVESCGGRAFPGRAERRCWSATASVVALCSLLAGCFATPEDAAEGGSTTGPTTGAEGTAAPPGTTTTDGPPATSGGSSGSTGSETTGADGSGSSTGTVLEPADLNYVFVTSQSLPLELWGSLEGADAFCQELAEAAELPGTFVAWLSDSETTALSRLEGARGWIRSDGKPVVDIREDLGAGVMLHPIERDESGELVTGAVLTGSSDAGAPLKPLCEDWTATVDWARTGNSAHAGFGWSSNTNRPCEDSHRFYCFGTDINEPLDLPAVEGRLAFISQATVTGDVGVDVMDQVCQAEGSVAREGATFRAFVGTNDTGPVARFDQRGLPWVNARGVALLDPGQQLMSAERLAAPVGFHADGAVPGTFSAWTGASSPSQTGFDCENWSSLEGSGLRGRSNATTSWLNLGTVDCTSSQRLLCFEE